jgi:hypothetical protein
MMTKKAVSGSETGDYFETEAYSEAQGCSEPRAGSGRIDTQQQYSLLIAWPRYDPSRRFPCSARVQPARSRWSYSVIRLFRCSVLCRPGPGVDELPQLLGYSVVRLFRS